MGEQGAADVEVSPRLRRTVRWFLLVFAVTGVAHLEVWPFTGFRLFSEIRHAEREYWSIVAVDPSGDERGVDLGGLPVGFRNTSRLLGSFEDLPPAERDEVCDAWVAPQRSAGQVVTQVRVYRVVDSVRPDGPPPQRTLTFECGTSG